MVFFSLSPIFFSFSLLLCSIGKQGEWQDRALLLRNVREARRETGRRSEQQSAARRDGGLAKGAPRAVWVLRQGGAHARSELVAARGDKAEGCEGRWAQMSLFAVLLGTWYFGNKCYLSPEQQGVTVSVRDKPRCVQLKDFEI